MINTVPFISDVARHHRDATSRTKDLYLPRRIIFCNGCLVTKVHKIRCNS